MNRPDLELRNTAGDAVDPWPFVVVTGLAFLLVFSFGPIYLTSFGLSLRTALAISTFVFAGLAAGAYHRLVRTDSPDLRGEVPAEVRLRRLIYWAIAVALVLGGLSLPFVSELF